MFTTRKFVTLAAMCIAVANGSQQSNTQRLYSKLNLPQLKAKLKSEKEARDTLKTDFEAATRKWRDVGQPLAVEKYQKVLTQRKNIKKQQKKISQDQWKMSPEQLRTKIAQVTKLENDLKEQTRRLEEQIRNPGNQLAEIKRNQARELSELETKQAKQLEDLREKQAKVLSDLKRKQAQYLADQTVLLKTNKKQHQKELKTNLKQKKANLARQMKNRENIQKYLDLIQHLKQLDTEHQDALKLKNEQKKKKEDLRQKYKSAKARVEALQELIKLREAQTNTPVPEIKKPQDINNTNRNSVDTGSVVQNNGTRRITVDRPVKPVSPPKITYNKALPENCTAESIKASYGNEQARAKKVAGTTSKIFCAFVYTKKYANMYDINKGDIVTIKHKLGGGCYSVEDKHGKERIMQESELTGFYAK